VITVRGALVALLGVATVVSGRVLGMLELYVIGAVMVALVASAWISTRLRTVKLEVTRELTPPRVYSGQATRIEVRATNRGTRRAPNLVLRDPVPGTRGAMLQVAPLSARESTRATYRLGTTGRGVLGIGPLTVEVADPLRLARTLREAAPRVQLTVLPAVEELPTERAGSSSRRRELGVHSAGARQSSDFAALRPYVQGDDLRQVHWPSSARHDDLVVREEEPLRDAHLQIVLDLRAQRYDHASFETAVSVAASVIHAAGQRNEPLHLVDGSGSDEIAVTARQRMALLEHLAVIEPMPTGGNTLDAALDEVRRRADRHRLVAITGLLAAADWDTVNALRRVVTELTLVVTEAPVVPPGGLHGVRLIYVPAGRSIAQFWSQPAPVGASA
jgi:uncharacterized protein (DUF58 family)